MPTKRKAKARETFDLPAWVQRNWCTAPWRLVIRAYRLGRKHEREGRRVKRG